MRARALLAAVVFCVALLLGIAAWLLTATVVVLVEKLYVEDTLEHPDSKRIKEIHQGRESR